MLPIQNNVVSSTIDFMKKYNLLPNDAIILSTCKDQNISVLASHDSDFFEACKAEGIRLISNTDDLNMAHGLDDLDENSFVLT